MSNEEFQYASMKGDEIDFESIVGAMPISAMADNPDEIDPALLEALEQRQREVSIRIQSQITAKNPSSAPPATIEEVDDDSIEDETILERIEALKEIFPSALRNLISNVNQTVVKTSKLTFTKGRTAAWWISSTMCVLVFPILIQKELLQVAEQISREQRSLLLGPQAASGAFNSAAF